MVVIKPTITLSPALILDGIIHNEGIIRKKGNDFYIETLDGKKYYAENLPDQLKVDGKKVNFRYKETKKEVQVISANLFSLIEGIARIAITLIWITDEMLSSKPEPVSSGAPIKPPTNYLLSSMLKK